MPFSSRSRWLLFLTSQSSMRLNCEARLVLVAGGLFDGCVRSRPSFLRRNQYNFYGDAKSLFLRVSAARKIPKHRHITYHAQNKFRQSLASGLLRERGCCKDTYAWSMQVAAATVSRICVSWHISCLPCGDRGLLVARPCMAFCTL